ncbi:DEAD/DEAH box helicase family protein [Cytobacillus firmus]|uniref:restriction endonuclease n=1 Tax=Cytobacillus firmus TaxID=1399 RepID=UPI001C8E4926|nr:DEAD/DEAH box helicase family protein [Cytobacillus firmus]MBX9974196.1 DEAD/DEAH box helicase family protein [Cytobacillus firmus]
MEFKFESNQDYQLKAIQSITNIFNGQPLVSPEIIFSGEESSLAAIPNQLYLDKHSLFENLKIVQKENRLVESDCLKLTEGEIDTVNGTKIINYPNFSVEMETGTGKTYVYIRTALELYKQYGFRKFIIVVPSVPVREGVIKTFKMTQKHFKSMFENTPYRYYEYSSDNLSRLRQFAYSDTVEFMVMTLASFNKDSNIIRQEPEELQGEKPLHFIQATRPILILDEPQNMESENSIAALSSLYPMFTLRYSATHRVPYNMVYRLTPFDAYRQNLVKKIEVDSVIEEDNENVPFISLNEIKNVGKVLKATLTIHKLTKSGNISPSKISVKPGDSLEKKSNRKEYSNFIIDEINAGLGYVKFTNNNRLQIGETTGENKEAIFEAQIRQTIVSHFEKQEFLKKDGIKVLSLFFIDKVDNFAGEDAIIKKLFIKVFNELKADLPEWKEKQAEDVIAAYFANRKTKSGEVIFEDSSSGESQKDKEVYDLIMKDKEKLLSFKEPVSFIFSHTALREGWDNPNVFQICTLNQTISEVRKRQEIGRGLRLAVNQQGDRIHDPRLNILTVIANESYEKFAKELQSEIAEEYMKEIEKRYGKPLSTLSEEELAKVIEEFGEGIIPPKPPKKRDRVVARLRKEYILDSRFQGLWEIIKQKTKYSVNINTEKLIQDVVPELNSIEVKESRVVIKKSSINVTDQNVFEAIQMTREKVVETNKGKLNLPNLVDLILSFMENTTPSVKLTRRTILAILKNMSKKENMIVNPQQFAIEAAKIIRAEVNKQLVDGIVYEKIDDWYKMEQFESEFSSWKENLIPSKRSIYDLVPCDSNVEKEFVLELEKKDYVKMYTKLPPWFKVSTPVGGYNPDWAIVIEEKTGEECLYFIRETKSVDDINKLRPEEKFKVKCGEKHFGETLGINYRMVSNANEI